MPKPNFTRRFFAFLAPDTLLVLSIGLIFPNCSRPEPLQIGPVEIPFEMVEEAFLSMTNTFVVEGRDSIRRSLLMNGLGSGALLHHRFANESEAARAAAQEYADRLMAGSPFEDEMRQWTEEKSLSFAPGVFKQPNPSALGAAVSAAVSSMEPGDWAGPLRTDYGWELVFLIERPDTIRNRAPVSLYRIQFPVGSQADRQQAKADWSTLPLSGNSELIDCLPLEFRRNRVVSPDQK